MIKGCVCVKLLQSCLTLRLLPTRLLCPWDSAGKNTGMVALSFSNKKLITNFWLMGYEYI